MTIIRSRIRDFGQWLIVFFIVVVLIQLFLISDPAQIAALADSHLASKALSTFAGITVLLITYTLAAKWLLGKHPKRRPLQKIKPNKKQTHREVWYTVLTSITFATMNLFAAALTEKGYANMYLDIAEYGWGYWVGSVIALLFITDTFFYWVHRLTHHKKIYKSVHKTHHLSRSPTPLTTMSFSPYEAALHSILIVSLFVVLPVHYSTLLVFGFLKLNKNIVAHLGYEIFPKSCKDHWLWKWVATVTHHDQHHRYFNCNYGLYFIFWDRWMGTLHPQYESDFEQSFSLAGATGKSAG